jgi:glycosyltransferase involved in cell wall biosynthesis
MKNKVSIITPTWKNIKYLEKTIKSVQAQTYRNFEHLIATEIRGSGAEKICSGYDVKFQYTRKERSDKINEMGARATGDYILVLCDDDLITPDFLEKTVSAMEEMDVDIVYTDMKRFGAMNNIVVAREWNDSIEEDTIPYITSLVKKSVWDKIGGYDHKLYNFADWDFWWTAKDMGCSAYHLPEPLFHYRIRENSDFNTLDKKRAKEEVQTKHFNTNW